MSQNPSLDICVCTRRRPDQLIELLESIPRTLAKLDQSLPGTGVAVVVVENDDSPRCRDRVLEAGARLGLNLRHVQEPHAGLSHARNKALEVCSAEFLLFVDDDEILDENLLVELLKSQQEFQADLVSGIAPILYPPGTPVSRIGYFDPPVRPYGSRLNAAATNCLLVRMSSLGKLPPPWFDPALNFSGGEDIDFTHRLVRAGAVLIANPRAIAWDKLPPERTTVGYIFRRTYRNWMVGAELMLRRGESTRLGLVGLAGRRFVAGLVLAPLRLVAGPKNRWEGLLRFVQAAGTLRALTGGKSGFYKQA